MAERVLNQRHDRPKKTAGQAYDVEQEEKEKKANGPRKENTPGKCYQARNIYY